MEDFLHQTKKSKTCFNMPDESEAHWTPYELGLDRSFMETKLSLFCLWNLIRQMFDKQKQENFTLFIIPFYFDLF